MSTNHHWEVVNIGDINIASTAEELWKQAVNYFRWCDEHPIVNKKKISVGKAAGTDMSEEKPRAYNLKGLCLHCGIEEEYLRDVRNTKDKSSLYYHVVSRILYVIYCQQYELAAVGELNPIFVSKALNMDEEEVPNTGVKVTIIGSSVPLSRSENEILEKLELENQPKRNDAA